MEWTGMEFEKTLEITYIIAYKLINDLNLIIIYIIN